MGKDKDTRFHATLQVTKMGSPAVLWSRDYPKERPVIWPAQGDRILLGWDLHSDAAGMEIKTNPKIHEEAGALKTGKKGLLLQSVVASTGKILDEVALPEIDLTGGADDERFAALSGDTVLVRGEHGNTAIYRMDTGKKVGEFFGAPVSGDAESGIIVAVNRESEMLLVDQKTGGELQRFSLGSPILAADVVGQNPKQLLVLTANQVVHRIPLPALAVASTQP